MRDAHQARGDEGRRIVFTPRRTAVCLLCSLLGAAAGCGQPAPASNPLDVGQQVPDAFEDLFAETRQSIRDVMVERGWPGVAIAVLDRDRILWSETFGVRDRGTGAVVTPETVFSIGSITKTVTATAVMLAVQDELVDLDCCRADSGPLKSRFRAEFMAAMPPLAEVKLV